MWWISSHSSYIWFRQCFWEHTLQSLFRIHTCTSLPHSLAYLFYQHSSKIALINIFKLHPQYALFCTYWLLYFSAFAWPYLLPVSVTLNPTCILKMSGRGLSILSYVHGAIVLYTALEYWYFSQDLIVPLSINLQ